MKKIACLFINLSNDNDKNYSTDTFFTPNAINSFKKWNPDVDVHFVNDSNFKEYCEKLKITEYYENVGLMKIHLAKELFNVLNYNKVISIGIDTLTCARVNEFIDNDSDDLICTSGASHIVSTEYFTTPIETFNENDRVYKDIPAINGDVICINNKNAAETLYNISLKYWTDHAEQGGMNYCYLNQKEVGLKVSIVDYPYYKTNVLYNIRSKGVVGGYCLIRGNVLAGRRGPVISNTYPSLLFYVNENKLYTRDNKQIKIFHYCEGLGCKLETDELTLEEQIHEMKYMWFNKETIEFFTSKCGCNF